jgi:hypothetical protein
MKNLTETLKSFISQIAKMEKDNEWLNEDIKEFEKEKAEAYKKFDTDTHILVEREKLESLIDSLEDTTCNSDNAVSDCEDAQSSIDNAKWNAEEVEGNVKDVLNTMEKLLKPKEEETEQSD